MNHQRSVSITPSAHSGKPQAAARVRASSRSITQPSLPRRRVGATATRDTRGRRGCLLVGAHPQGRTVGTAAGHEEQRRIRLAAVGLEGGRPRRVAAERGGAGARAGGRVVGTARDHATVVRTRAVRAQAFEARAGISARVDAVGRCVHGGVTEGSLGARVTMRTNAISQWGANRFIECLRPRIQVPPPAARSVRDRTSGRDDAMSSTLWIVIRGGDCSASNTPSASLF